MTWELEFRRVKDASWFVFTKGSLEECLEDALELKAGMHGWGHSYDAARLGFVRPDLDGEPTPPPLAAERPAITDTTPRRLVSVRCGKCGQMHDVDFFLTRDEVQPSGIREQEWTGRLPVCPKTPIEITVVAAEPVVWG